MSLSICIRTSDPAIGTIRCYRAGSGYGAAEQILTLDENAQLPVDTSLFGLDSLSASHLPNLGMMSMYGEARIHQTIQKADLLITCGMSVVDRITGCTSNHAGRTRKSRLNWTPANSISVSS